jgi:hypothetical protein
VEELLKLLIPLLTFLATGKNVLLHLGAVVRGLALDPKCLLEALLPEPFHGHDGPFADLASEVAPDGMGRQQQV